MINKKKNKIKEKIMFKIGSVLFSLSISYALFFHVPGISFTLIVIILVGFFMVVNSLKRMID